MRTRAGAEPGRSTNNSLRGPIRGYHRLCVLAHCSPYRSGRRPSGPALPPMSSGRRVLDRVLVTSCTTPSTARRRRTRRPVLPLDSTAGWRPSGRAGIVRRVRYSSVPVTVCGRERAAASYGDPFDIVHASPAWCVARRGSAPILRRAGHRRSGARSRRGRADVRNLLGARRPTLVGGRIDVPTQVVRRPAARNDGGRRGALAKPDLLAPCCTCRTPSVGSTVS